MKKNLRITLTMVALWFGLGMGTVNAALIQPVLSANGSNWDAIFGSNAVLGPFSDVFSLTLPANSAGLGMSVISGFSFGGVGGFNVNITSLSLVDATTSTTLATGAAGNFSVLSYAGFLDATHDFQVLVGGTLNGASASGSYSGNIQISPVPEPETYAMLLVGLGLIGLTLRHRSRRAS